MSGNDFIVSIALVDDDPGVLQILHELLQEFGFKNLRLFNNGPDALNGFDDEPFDVVITDFKMPGMDGFQLLDELHKRDSKLPVIILTGYADMNNAVDSFKHGAFGFIIKPFQALQIVNELKRATSARKLSNLERDYKKELEETVLQRTVDLRTSLEKMNSMNKEIIYRLGIAAELRDDETGSHISRIAYYVMRLATLLGIDPENAQEMAMASTMHDIGKIGIPDSILFKKGSLTNDEFDTIKSHTLIGGRMLSGSSFDILEQATSIALSHHERFDGTGYPNGLKGEAIPLCGRITMIADHYDALRSERPYKPAFGHEKTCDIILIGDGRTVPTHFDPNILAAFRDHASDFDEIFNETQKNQTSMFNTDFNFMTFNKDLSLSV